jgi:hypothetical protein
MRQKVDRQMKKCLVILAVLALLLLTIGGCDNLENLLGSSDNSTEENVNFRLLISDEANVINEFETLYVTITIIGVHPDTESASWNEIAINLTDPVNLVELQGDNATEIWSGQLDPGTYNKIFIYVSDVDGELYEDVDGEYTVKLPSGKLHISQPFEVVGGEVTEFVYDITVIKAGESGQYILRPQIAESGADKDFEEVD